MESHPYFNRQVVLTSKHKKLNLIEPAFMKYVGCKLLESELDTDQFGTFSGEVERTAPPRETAIKKARLGMKQLGIPIGIASEGSIGPDPIAHFVNSDIEYLVLVDDENGIVISEVFRSFNITAATITCAPNQDLSTFLVKVDFPRHGLIVRPDTQIKDASIKGITDIDELRTAIAKSSLSSPNGKVVVESDLRAMFSPTRQENIREAANLLARKVSQLCSECHAPGWGRVGYEKGLLCSECGSENPEAIRQERLGCAMCEFTKLGEAISQVLDPTQCEFCNP